MKLKLKNIKRCSLFILMLFTIFGTISCNKVNNEEEETYCLDYVSFPVELEHYCYNKNIYVTSIGQSNDIDQIEFIFDDNKINYYPDRYLDSTNIKDNSVIFVCVGSSTKSMEMAGVSVETEINRANSLINLANNNTNIDLIGIHIGGKARRGDNSDRFIELIFPNSIFNIYLLKGDYDGYIHTICVDNHRLCMSIDSYYSLKNVLINLVR